MEKEKQWRLKSSSAPQFCHDRADALCNSRYRVQRTYVSVQGVCRTEYDGEAPVLERGISSVSFSGPELGVCIPLGGRN